MIRDFERVIARTRDRSYKRIDKLRGLRYNMGCQTDRLPIVLLRNVLWSSLAIVTVELYFVPRKTPPAYMVVAIVGLSVLLWDKSKGGWSTAFGIGQLIAACIALLSMYTQEQAQRH